MIKNLTPGSKCVVYSAASNDDIVKTSGRFEGFVPVGEESSLCIVLDETHGDMAGKVRLIPTNTIAAIDIIELAKKEDKVEKYEANHYFS